MGSFRTNLVSDMAGAAAHTDPKLINPWGIALVPGQQFWVAAGSLLASTGCCGAASSGVADRVTASIVVTATSGALSHTSTINLTVQ